MKQATHKKKASWHVKLASNARYSKNYRDDDPPFFDLFTLDDSKNIILPRLVVLLYHISQRPALPFFFQIMAD